MRATFLGYTSALTLSLLACSTMSSEDPPAVAISAAPATTSGDYKEPLDAVPSSNGQTFFFTAKKSDGSPAIFQVPISGGIAALIAFGAPLLLPTSIAISGDQKKLYVTDSGGSGQIVVVTIADGSISVLPGTAGTAPVGIEVGQGPSGDLIYFTGVNAKSGKPGVFTIAPAGGTPSTILEGEPLVAPGGVTVGKGGEVYVVNTQGLESDTGCIYTITGGAAQQLACDLRFGKPSGITLDLAETTVLASGIDKTGHDQVYAIDLASKKVATAADGISQNTKGGGVHRAFSTDVFAWADASAGGRGVVYRITLR